MTDENGQNWTTRQIIRYLEENYEDWFDYFIGYECNDTAQDMAMDLRSYVQEIVENALLPEAPWLAGDLALHQLGEVDWAEVLEDRNKKEYQARLLDEEDDDFSDPLDDLDAERIAADPNLPAMMDAAREARKWEDDNG